MGRGLEDPHHPPLKTNPRPQDQKQNSCPALSPLGLVSGDSWEH